MPWVPTYDEAQLRTAVEGARGWSDVLHSLGLRYHGKTIDTARRWAHRWGIPVDHLSDLRGSPARRLDYSDERLREVVARSLSWAAVLRELGYCPTGGNWKTVQRKCAQLVISTEHFDPYAANRAAGRRRRVPLEDVLVKGSTYSRNSLKARLYEDGLKERRCEQCGQDETWRGRKIGLILDHVNGVRDDHRLANLRIVCPNCAAALDTHCGRKNRLYVDPRPCLRCSKPFEPRHPKQRYCSRACGSRWDRRAGARPSARRRDRPTGKQLARDIAELGYRGTGRKYGVSDNAIRKWVRDYERSEVMPLTPAAP